MPRSLHTPSPTPQPDCIAEPARGRIDQARRTVQVALAHGVTGRLDVDSGSVFLLDSGAPETDTTPLLPGIAPGLGSYLAELYETAGARLGRRRAAKLIMA